MSDALSKVFNRVILNDYVKLHPRLITRNSQHVILEKIKEKLEGKCTRHGYIKKDSIEIYKITPGKLELVGLNGYVQYNVHFHADVCNPLVGSIVKSKVVNVNKFGILANAGFYSNSEFVNILEIIVAKNSVNIVSEVDLEDVSIGDELMIEVVGKKFELGDNKLSIVGRVVKDTDGNIKKKRAPPLPAAVVAKSPEINEEEEAEDAIEAEVDNEEEEGEDESLAGEDESVAEEEVDEEADEEDDAKSSKSGGGFFSSDAGSDPGDYEIFGGSDAEEGGAASEDDI